MANQNDSLTHHGVLGQKWGVRRYQNYDGSLKSAGRMKAREKYKMRETKKLTDNELKRRTNRLNLENNYKQALDRNNDSYNDGVKWLDKTFTAVLSSVVTGVAVAAGTYYVGGMINDAAGVRIIKNGR